MWRPERRPGTERGAAGAAAVLLWFAAASGWRPLALVLGAAAVHEGGHLLVLRLWGAKVTGFRLSAFGAAIEADCARLSYARELSAVLAGPAANLLCALGLARLGVPWTAFIGANIVLCVYNLLPVRPLDGGRALELAASWAWDPVWGDRIARGTGAVWGLGLAAGLGYVMVRTGGSLWLIVPASGFLLRAVQEFSPRSFRSAAF